MKRLVVLVLVIAAVIGAAIAAAPYVAATDIAKRRIAAQIEEWTGRPVTFVGEPTVKLFPFLALTIEDAKIGDNSESDGEPFVVMDRLTCKLRLLPFLIGRTDIAEFQFVRPRLHLAVDASGRKNWDLKRRLPGAIGSPSQTSDTKPRRLKIIDGMVTYDNARNGRHEKIGAVSVNLSGLEDTEAISGTGAFTWRGKLVEFNTSISQPLGLIAGETSSVRINVVSKPLRVSFTGTANALADFHFEGATTVTAPSVRRAAEWFGAEMEESPILGPGLIEGTLNWIGPSVSFSDARIELDGNSAEGRFTVDLAAQRPRIQGSVALERLDLTAYLEALQASITASGPWPLAPIDFPFLAATDADIRISADRILLGAMRTGVSSASLTIDDSKLTVSLGEAQFHGGQLDANAMVEMSDSAMTASADITFENASAGVAFAGFSGLSLLDGTTSATVSLGGRGDSWGSLATNLSGTAHFKIADGMFAGIELSQIAGLSGGAEVADAAIGSGAVPFDSLAGTLKLTDGVVESRDIHMKGKTFAIDLGGQVSLIDAALRGNGVLSAAKTESGTGKRKEIPFVVGGLWSAPLILPDYERLFRRGAKETKVSPPIGTASKLR